MFKLTAAFVVTVLAAATASAQAQINSPQAFASALVVAQRQVPSGTLIRGRFETDRFGFYFFNQGKIVEIEIRMDMVVKNTSKDGDKVTQDVAQTIKKKTKGKTKLPDGRLLEIAKDALKGTPISSLQYIQMGDKLVMKVGDLLIDAETGKIISGN